MPTPRHPAPASIRSPPGCRGFPPPGEQMARGSRPFGAALRTGLPTASRDRSVPRWPRMLANRRGAAARGRQRPPEPAHCPASPVDQQPVRILTHPTRKGSGRRSAPEPAVPVRSGPGSSPGLPAEFVTNPPRIHDDLVEDLAPRRPTGPAPPRPSVSFNRSQCPRSRPTPARSRPRPRPRLRPPVPCAQDIAPRAPFGAKRTRPRAPFGVKRSPRRACLVRSCPCAKQSQSWTPNSRNELAYSTQPSLIS
jgi:hypothetical protein